MLGAAGDNVLAGFRPRATRYFLVASRVSGFASRPFTHPIERDLPLNYEIRRPIQ
jgi:hypothetical protein